MFAMLRLSLWVTEASAALVVRSNRKESARFGTMS
jgi:hypothetical protein